MDYEGLYKFHGHVCPMSTMGARLGLAAMSALGVTKVEQFYIEARCFMKNCALDGVQFTTGCTFGNGNIAFEDGGRVEMVISMRDGSRAVTVRISDAALERFAETKGRKAVLTEERAISGLPRAMEIDSEIKRATDALVLWVQSAPDGDLVAVTGP